MTDERDETEHTPRRGKRRHYLDDEGSRFPIEDQPSSWSHRKIKNTKKKIQAPVEHSKESANLKEGILIEVSRKKSKVLVGDEMITCLVGGMFLNREESLLATGDRVLVEKLPEDWVIRRVMPRVTKLSRPAAEGTGLSQVREKIIASNIDVIVIVTSVNRPSFKPALVDRYLLTAHRNDVEVLIVLNKIDLEKDIPLDLSDYENLGIRTIRTSTITGVGIEELGKSLQHKIGVFSGHSGVGKSSLLNALCPELDLETQNRGEGKHCWRHTTRKSTLYRIPGSGMIIDTPGIRELGITKIAPEALSWYFPEFHESAESCRFSNCTHDHEPGCQVAEEVDNENISLARYASYLRVLHELKSRAPHYKHDT